MRYEVSVTGAKLLFEQNRRTRVRVEMALNMPWSEIQDALNAGSEAVREQIIISSFSDEKGNLIPEGKILEYMEKYPDSFKKLFEEIAAAGKSPEATGVLPPNSSDGVASDLTPEISGGVKIGKSKQSMKAE